MKQILGMVILTLFMTLNAKESYPELFFKQGTPLYKATSSFKSLEKVPKMKVYIDEYIVDANKIKELGFKVDTPADKKSYLKSLRRLQKSHDRVIGLSTKIVYNSIEHDNYQEFKKMINFGISDYKKRAKLKREILSYYKKNRTKGRITSLEKLLRYDRSVTKRYDNSEHVFSQTTSNKTVPRVNNRITVLYADGCGWCRKLKAYLDKNSIAYRDLNVKNSEGARLYRKHNGSGVPITIVNNKVIRGYNPERIMEEIQ